VAEHFIGFKGLLTISVQLRVDKGIECAIYRYKGPDVMNGWKDFKE
jgi:hypothetical protein